MVALVAVGIITYHVTKHGGTEALTMDGGWSTWSSWDSCSATCGIGQTQRRRQCDNNKACEGDVMESQLCFNTSCPNVGRSTWSSWGSCSATCGIGQTQRRRQCDNSKACDGDVIESQVCFNTSCPDGGWGTWSTWDTCSATCGTGLARRPRQCDNPTPLSFGKPCDGDSTESQLCFNITCPDSKSSFSVDDLTSNINYYLTFSDVIHNLGGDFNASTGLFTCTKPGVYVFSFSLVKKRSSSRVDRVYMYYYLRKNNAYVALGKVDPADDDTDRGNAYVSHTVILHLDVTDTVGLRHCSDPSTTMESWTSFSGFLLYPDNQN